MATNDFLPFATGAGANVLSQSDYAALAALATGYQSGIAKSQQLNKTWRQSSIMAAVLAQFISDQTGANSVDDGTTATLLSNLKAAAKATSSTLISQSRNLSMNVTAASSTATVTADEIIVASALGGLKYVLSGFNKSINLATTGAGGMDTGSAPASGFVGIYAIYNPTTGASALLGVNASNATISETYAGANMPVGFSASALISIVPTNSSSQLQQLVQKDRTVDFGGSAILSTSTAAGSITTINNLIVPLNAKSCSGFMQVGNSSAAAMGMSIFAQSVAVGGKVMAANLAAGTSVAVPFEDLLMAIPQRVYYSSNVNTGTATFVIQVNRYRF